MIAAVTGAGRVETLARLPERIALSDVVNAFAQTPDGGDLLNVPFAIGETALQPVGLPLPTMPNLLVVGRQGCGKTTALAAFGQSIMSRFSPEQAQITIIDPKTSLIGKMQGPHVRAYAYTADDVDATLAALTEELRDRLPPSGLTQEELLSRSRWQGPHHFVLIDDEQELRPNGVLGKQAASAPLWPLIERCREIGLHVLVSRLPGNWFMDNDPQTVKVFGRVSAQQLPPGRGLLVTTDGDIEGVLVGAPE